MTRARLALLLTLMLTLLPSCLGQRLTESVPEVLDTFPHDTSAFTQGLLLHDGRLYESTGLYGSSSLREVILETGEVVRQRDLDGRYFGEGLALVGDRLIQLTWREERALLYDLDTFDPVGEFRYDGEGWGLCFDGEALYMSNGSATLTERDPETFSVRREINVTLRGEPLRLLNELACVGEHIYANVFTTDRIVQIDKQSGQVVSDIDASGLFPPETRAELSREAVLNGIAHNPETDTFYVTGKLWPNLFEVRFVSR